MAAMKRSKPKILNYCICCVVVAQLLLTLNVLPAEAEGEAGVADAATWSSPLILFQRVISRADGDRCPMAPSCSHYAATAFRRHHPVTAWILTCDRLLRCGHDEVRMAPGVRIDGRTRTLDPVAANTFWWTQP
jgi:uncharacterized protein